MGWGCWRYEGDTKGIRRGYGGDTEGNTFDHIIDHGDKSGLSGNGTGMGTEIDGHMVTLYKLIE